MMIGKVDRDHLLKIDRIDLRIKHSIDWNGCFSPADLE